MKLSLKNILLPLLLLGFVGVAVTFLSPIFTTTTRWMVLAGFTVYAIFRRQMIGALKMRVALMAVVYCVWGIMTVAWSEQQYLSLLKSVAAVFVTVPVIAGGIVWAKDRKFEDILDVLYPLTIAALAAGVLGRFSTAAIVMSGKTILYQGLVDGPNMFGSMLAMCSPFLIWKLHSNWRNGRWKWVWLVAAVLAAYYLSAASSRGAIMVVLVTVAFFLMTLSMTKKLQFGVLGVIGLVLALMVIPNGYERFMQQYVFKQGNQIQGVFYTRQEVWEVSLEKAKEGGMVGGGYGVSIGNRRMFTGGFSGGLSAIGYGREKGNTQLAIVEEVGLIGFALYLILMVMLFGRLAMTAMSWPPGNEKRVFMLVIGVLVGMTVQSFFEAWWVAPGSPEYVFFWTMAGVGLGLSTYKPQSHLKAMEAPRKHRHRRQVLVAGDGATT